MSRCEFPIENGDTFQPSCYVYQRVIGSLSNRSLGLPFILEVGFSGPLPYWRVTLEPQISSIQIHDGWWPSEAEKIMGLPDHTDDF